MGMKLSVVCILLLMAGVALSSDPNGPASDRGDKSVADGNSLVKDGNGPTILLGYSKQGFKKNPISSFAYFVPLISTTLVERYTSANNDQQVGIISYEKKVTSKSFYLACEFEILGKGFHKNTFEPAGVIAMYIGALKKGETLTNLLDYIKFEGEGFGRIEVKGTIKGSTQTVTDVDLQFNARDHKSCVTVGLYDIKPKDGQYKYENRSNQVVARVNTLSFKKTNQTPHMGIKVASISTKAESDGFLSSIKGAIANLFLNPPEVTKLGNQTMLDFGHTLLQQKPAFTFPKAKNIKEDKLVPTNKT
jgi:hypothetical protein